MRSSFFGLNTLLRALQAQQQALDTTNHNIANTGTDGYSRQRVTMTATAPYTAIAGNKPQGTALQLGTGVVVSEIRRERDLFLDLELRNQTQQQARWDSTAAGLGEVEAVFNEPGDLGLRNLITAFFSAWSDLSNNPQSGAARTAVRSAGDQLAHTLNDTSRRLSAARQAADGQIALAVPEINDLSARIASLNAQIANLLAQGDAPNDMLDERDRLLDQVVGLTGAVYRGESDGTVTVLLGGRALVSGDRVNRLVTETTNLADGTQIHQLEWASDSQTAKIDGGGLAGLIALRDEVLPQQLRQLDLLASTMAGTVNQVHRGGFGIGAYADKVSNFFDTMMGAPLSQTGLGHDLVAGTITIGNATISVDPLNQSLTEVMDQITTAIDGQPGVTTPSTWSLDPQTGRISLAFQTNLTTDTVQFGGGSDTSNLLQLLGLAGGSQPVTGGVAGNYDRVVIGTTAVPVVSAARIGLDAAIKTDVNAIAAAAGQSSNLTTAIGPGDNTNALALMALQRTAFDALSDVSFEDFYSNAAADLGAQTRQAEQTAATQQLLVEHLEARRESLSGVSLDEEATKLIQYQRAYQAAARGISALDEMLETIITRMGRVGN